jgi:GntR family transcriptional regulator/MocR family aminotransferase
MRRVPNSIAPLIPLDRDSSVPLHKQIYNALRDAVLSGRLRPRQQVPSTRTLAREIGVSRIPVLSAYAQLQAEGYLETLQGSGTYICRLLPEDGLTTGDQRRNIVAIAGPRRVSMRSSNTPAFRSLPWVSRPGAFTVGQVAVEHFPVRIWSELVGRHVKRTGPEMLHFGDPMGLPAFRMAIANYLQTHRGVICSAEQIMVVNGSQQALELCTRVLTDDGDAIWMEEPGYTLARHVFELWGCRIVPVPIDSEGLDVQSGTRLYSTARAAYVTPSHQYPLGSVMSTSRRLRLLEWAQSNGSWIIEDDYDSEYRFESTPLASLQGLDQDSRVLYIGTFSKTLFPAVRTGYVVIPRDLIARFQSARLSSDIFPSSLYQAALTDFINEGHFARHLRRMRTVYRERRNVLLAAVKGTFGSDVRIKGEEAGMHFTAVFPDLPDDEEVAVSAAERGLWLWPLSRCYHQQARYRGFVLGFGNTPPSAIPGAVRFIGDFVWVSIASRDLVAQTGSRR